MVSREVMTGVVPEMARSSVEVSSVPELSPHPALNKWVLERANPIQGSVSGVSP